MPASPAELLAVYAPSPEPDQEVEPVVLVVTAWYEAMIPSGSVNEPKVLAEKFDPLATLSLVGLGGVTVLSPPPPAPGNTGAIGMTKNLRRL